MLRASLAALVLLTATSELRATVIIAVIRPDGVFIAADSKASDGSVVCKIGGFDSRFFFAVSGMPSDPNTSFDVQKIIGRAFVAGSTFDQRVRIMKEQLDGDSKQEVAWLKINAPPNEFRKIVSSGEPIVSVILAQLEGGKPRLAEIEVNYDMQSGTVTTESTVATTTEIFYMGTRKAIDPLRSPDTQRFDADVVNSTDIKAKLTRVIQLEIDAEGEIVGPPIRILAINNRGTSWSGEGCSLAL